MFKFITQDIEVTDRYRLSIKIVDGIRSFENLTMSRLLICNGSITGDSISGKGTLTASLTQKFMVEGHAAVIELTGHCMAEEMLARINPTSPGNLSYIDGCSNSCIIPAPRNGDPCLNYLYFPPGVDQTFHTHPSIRIGMVLSGTGYADVGDQTFELSTGKIFLLDRFALHRFRTTDSSMSLVAFHPDSEDGPKDEVNPMISRTYLSK
jgi:quercetin dioxygenase-like cupin family protein